MALQNLTRRTFLALPSSFSKNLNGSNSGITSSLFSSTCYSSLSCKWLNRSSTKVDNASCIADHARRHFRTCSILLKRDDLSRGQMVAAMPKLDEGTLGENLVDVTYNEQTGLFPDKNTPNKLFDGVRYADLPICHIKTSPNNTIISLTDSAGVVKSSHSCGKEGFKNTREGTNIAAQATAITLSTRGVSMGYKTVRVTVSGLGPGRMAAIKGLTMGGMNVVSITDRTPVSWTSNPRPKKRRKL